MIILLNGCINSGKSSTGRALARLLPRAAHVELDDLRHFMTGHSPGVMPIARPPMPATCAAAQVDIRPSSQSLTASKSRASDSNA
jgi:hypothetical protein